MSLSRQQRRRLTRRSDRVMDRVRGTLMTIDVTKDWVLAREGDDPIRVVDGNLAHRVLDSMGLGDLAEAIEASRGTYGPAWVPTVILIDSWATACWVETYHLVRGGVA